MLTSHILTSLCNRALARPSRLSLAWLPAVRSRPGPSWPRLSRGGVSSVPIEHGEGIKGLRGGIGIGRGAAFGLCGLREMTNDHRYPRLLRHRLDVFFPPSKQTPLDAHSTQHMPRQILYNTPLSNFQPPTAVIISAAVSASPPIPDPEPHPVLTFLPSPNTSP